MVPQPALLGFSSVLSTFFNSVLWSSQCVDRVDRVVQLWGQVYETVMVLTGYTVTHHLWFMGLLCTENRQSGAVRDISVTPLSIEGGGGGIISKEGQKSSFNNHNAPQRLSIIFRHNNFSN